MTGLMKTCVVLVACMVAMFAESASAQVRGQLRERVKAAGNRAAVKPTATEAQQENIKQLQADLAAIKAGSEVTPEQIEALKKSLNALVSGATKPDPALVEKLATELAEAKADGELTTAELLRLSQDLEAVFNSAGISQAELEKALNDIQKILLASGVDKSDVQTIMNDLKKIAAEAKSNAGSRPRLRR